MKYIPRAPMLSAKTNTTWRGREKEKKEMERISLVKVH